MRLILLIALLALSACRARRDSCVTADECAKLCGERGVNTYLALAQGDGVCVCR